MYKTSYCIYSISHFIKIIKNPFSDNQDKWLGWKDWLNKKFCDKFMEMNAASVSQQKEPTTPPQNKNIKELNDLTKAGADPKAIGEDSRFNAKVEILPENQYLMDFLKQSKFDFGLSSYNAHSQLMKAINKTFTADSIKKMQDGKFAIDYLLNQQVSQNEELEIVDGEELIIEDLTESVDLHSKAIPNQQISNSKENISKKALGEAWIAAVNLITQQNFMDLRKKFSTKKKFINETASDVIKKLYEQDNSILNYTDNEGNNAVHISASSRVFDLRQGLLRILEGLDKDCTNQLKLMANKKGHNALQTAVICRHPDMVDALLGRRSLEQKQTLLTTSDQAGNNPLHLAVIANDSDVVDTLLGRCSLDQKQSLLTAVNHQGNTPIMEAITNSELKKLETQVRTKQFADKCWEFIRTQPTPETTVRKQTLQTVETNNQFQDTENGKAKQLTLGEVECKIRNTEFYELMCSLNSEDMTQYTTSNLIKSDNKTLASARKNNLSVFNKLLSHSDLAKDRKKFLKAAIINNNKVIVSSLLEQGKGDVNSCDEQGKSLLELTMPQYGPIYREKIEMLGLLIGKGANVNIQNNEGRTLLYNAVYIIQPSMDKITQYLLKKDADPNLQDDNGDTVLHCAAQIGNTQAISLLIQNGADINIQNARGETPLHIALPNAMTFNQYPIVEVLLRHKADPNVQNNEGNTPLHIALKNNDIQLSKKLIEVGADLIIYDAKGKPSLDAEGKSSLDYVIEILDKDREQFMAILDVMSGKALGQIYDSMLKKLPAHRSEIKEVVNEKLMSKYPSENNLSQIIQKQINPTVQGTIPFILLQNSTPKKPNSLGAQKPWPSKDVNNFSNLISNNKVEEKNKVMNSFEEDTLSYVGNFFAQFEQNAQINEEGDGVTLVIDILGEPNSGQSASGAMVHYTG